MRLLLEDLRFFIGAFFALIGVILVIAGSINPVDTAGYNMNVVVGIVFTVFGAGALALAFAGVRKA